MKSTPHAEYLSYFILLLLSMMSGMMLADDTILDRAIELIFVAVLILTMILLLYSIRLMQPDYARHPLAYSYIPLIIFPFYIIFIDNQILSDITFLSIQTTCLIVYAGISATYFKTLQKGYLLLVSLVFFIMAFALYWLINSDQDWILSLTHLLSGIGMITASFRFPALLSKHKR